MIKVKRGSENYLCAFDKRTDKMANEGTWYRPAELILLSFSLILQLVSLATPGWYIHIVGNEEIYDAVFYQTRCSLTNLGSVCKVTTKHEISVEKSKKEGLEQDHTYNHQLMEQVTVVVALIATIICFAVQVRLCRNRHETFLLTNVFAGFTLAFSGGLMIRHLMFYYVYINRTLDDSFSGYIIFPYCVLLYTVAFVTLALTVLLHLIEIFKTEKRREKEDMLIGTEDIAMAPN